MVKLEAPKIETKEEVVDEGEYASFLIKPNEVLLGLKAFVEENVNQLVILNIFFISKIHFYTNYNSSILKILFISKTHFKTNFNFSK